MHEGRFLFAQVMDHLPRHVFDACVAQFNGDYNAKGFSCRDHFRAMAFAHLTRMSGLQGIANALDANSHCLYHMGFRCKAVPKSTLAHANKTRPWQIYAHLALDLMQRAQQLYADDALAIDFDKAVFAIDSTTIDLCLSRFPWTPSQQSKASVKMHVLLNLRGSIPDFLVISPGKVHDIHFLDQVTYVPGAYYAIDRAYVDYDRLWRLHQSKAFFVTRSKKNMGFTVSQSRPVDKATGLRCDQSVRLTHKRTSKEYPDTIRRIKYRDEQTGKTLVFLTNDFDLPALMIAQLYKQRWQIELFFKWIKQHLKIKTFYGHSENAVRTQLWIAVAVYCLLAIIKKTLGGDRDLHEIQEILSASLFQKMPLFRAFSKEKPKPTEDGYDNQLSLFEL